MNEIEKVSDVFSILHDGTISAWIGDRNLLTLTDECECLAERINSSFDKFYVELFNILTIELDPWMNPIELATIIKTDF